MKNPFTALFRARDKPQDPARQSMPRQQFSFPLCTRALG